MCEYLIRRIQGQYVSRHCELFDSNPSQFQCKVCTSKKGVIKEIIPEQEDSGEYGSAPVDETRCNGCEHFNPVNELCKKHGCVARARIPNPDVRCPSGRW